MRFVSCKSEQNNGRVSPDLVASGPNNAATLGGLRPHAIGSNSEDFDQQGTAIICEIREIRVIRDSDSMPD